MSQAATVDNQMQRQQLRRQMRQRRRSLTSGQQRSAAQQLLRRLARQPLFVRSRHIAFYIANDGEIDPRPLLERALAMGKHCYLPVLARDNTHWNFSATPQAQACSVIAMESPSHRAVAASA